MHIILVIDDDDWLRASILATLGKNGFMTIEAGDGSAGVALARSHKPDLVLCDVNLPGIDGYEVLRLMRSQPVTSGIPLILMTGAIEANDVRHSMELGADDYLPKPIATQTLLRAVRMRIARRTAVELQIQELSSRLLAIVDATPNLVTVLEAATGELVYLNPAGRAMLAVGSDEKIGEIIIEDHFQDKDGSRSFRSYLEIARTSGKCVREGKVIDRRGRSLPVEIQLLAHETGSEKTTWLSILARDLTETIQLRQAHKMEGIGRLASGIAHEINTPIQFTQHNLHFIKTSFAAISQAMAGYERLLLTAKSGATPPELVSEIGAQIAAADLDYLKKEIESAITDAMQGTERVAKIVKAMKEFSHPGGGGEKPEAADLNQAIASTITIAQNEWKYVADVAAEFDPSMPPVPIIVGEFNQVVLNLLVNAAHAVSDAIKGAGAGKGKITVSTLFLNGWAQVSIRDTGSGIPENVRNRIFEPFFTTKEIGKGTGQGLALARSVIVEKHKGDIRFETEVGKGTCFIIQLPVTASVPGQKLKDRLS
jgi:signal transduction histidine kinase